MTISKSHLQFLFGQHVKQIRVSKGLTQVEVSSRMNKDQQSLQRIESGRVSPNIYYLHLLSSALDITLCELVDFEIKKEKKKRAK
ncbi:MAG: helix-turn-helix transcriptional regulator [Bacteroidota bacterium]